jgi:hypothetical protein
MQLHFQASLQLRNAISHCGAKVCELILLTIWQDARPINVDVLTSVHMLTLPWFILACIPLQPGKSWSRAVVTFGDVNAARLERITNGAVRIQMARTEGTR